MEFTEVIKERYSCKKFDGRAVEKDQLEAILQAGRLALHSGFVHDNLDDGGIAGGCGGVRSVHGEPDSDLFTDVFWRH